MKRVGAALLVASLSFPLSAYHVDPSYNRDRTGLAVVHPDGRVSISPKAEEARPALSLAKLYLGYYVLYNGTKAEKKQVEEMIASSDDGIASPVSYTHLTCRRRLRCRSRWSPYH